MMKQIEAERRADMLRNVINEANEVGFRFPRMAVADLLLIGGGAPELRRLLVRANEDTATFVFPDDAVSAALAPKRAVAETESAPEPDPAVEAEKETRRKRTRKKAAKKS